MFFTRDERSKIQKEKIAQTRSTSTKMDSKAFIEGQESNYVNEKILKIRPKSPKNYYFSKEKSCFVPNDLWVNSFRVNPIKRDSLKKL